MKCAIVNCRKIKVQLFQRLEIVCDSSFFAQKIPDRLGALVRKEEMDRTVLWF